MMVASRTSSTFLDRFSRITSSDRLVPEVEGLRFIAIFLVVVYHVSVNVAANYTMPFVIAPNHPWRTHLA